VDRGSAALLYVMPNQERNNEMELATAEITEDQLRSGDYIRVEGIDWDTDGDDPLSLELPLDTQITIPHDWCEGESVADLLSDQYGYCIHGISTITRL